MVPRAGSQEALVHMVKISGEIDTADLMTKHPSNLVIIKHLQNLHPRHTTGRAEAAANLHALRPMAEINTDRVIEKTKVQLLDVDNLKE